MTIKEQIREAEESIERTLDALEEETNVRAFRLTVLSQRGDDASINISTDDRGGRYT
jgi:hypothetical protein